MGARSALGRVGLSLFAVGLVWAGWSLFGEATPIGGAHGGSPDYQYPSYTAPLVLVVGGILAMIGARFIRKDP